MPTALTPEQVAHDLTIRDLTDPSEGAHALQLLIDDASAALSSSWGCAVRTARGPRIVPLADNYDRLRFPPAAVTRDARLRSVADVIRRRAAPILRLGSFESILTGPF